jgi:D-alanyl-D-alanine carboxypeptidase (penicillin-binding protein 5/6)
MPVGLVRLAIALLVAFPVVGAASARAEAFSAAAPFALIEDYETGSVLYEKDADAPMPPGATAKLLTAEIVFHNLKEGKLHLDDVFEVSEKAWREGGAPSRGAAMFLSLHSRVQVDDLLRGLLIQSGNDAALTLAEAVAGSEDNFTEMMNKRAAEIGMAHSHFANARGKADPNQTTTARDLALLAAHVIRQYPEYYHYFSEKEFTWNKIRQLNRNPLLTLDMGVDGLKAGDVADGSYAIIGSAVQDGQRIILVANGFKSAQERLEESRKLLGYGFHSFDRRTLFEAGATVGQASVYGGRSSEAPLVSDKPIVLFVPRGESDKLIGKIVYSGPLVAPVEPGKEIGRLRIWRGDMLVIDAPLKTGARVELGGLASRAFDAGVEFAGDLVRRALAKQ